MTVTGTDAGHLPGREAGALAELHVRHTGCVVGRGVELRRQRRDREHLVEVRGIDDVAADERADPGRLVGGGAHHAARRPRPRPLRRRFLRLDGAVLAGAGGALTPGAREHEAVHGVGAGTLAVEVGVRQPERIDEPRADELFVRGIRSDLRDATEHDVPGVQVGVFGARREDGRAREDVVDELLRRHVADEVEVELAEAALVLQQHPHRDLRTAGSAREPAVDRVIERQHALLVELHDERGGEQLRHAADVKGGCLIERHARSAVAARGRHDSAVADRRGEHGARDRVGEGPRGRRPPPLQQRRRHAVGEHRVGVSRRRGSRTRAERRGEHDRTRRGHPSGPTHDRFLSGCRGSVTRGTARRTP